MRYHTVGNASELEEPLPPGNHSLPMPRLAPSFRVMARSPGL